MEIDSRLLPILDETLGNLIISELSTTMLKVDLHRLIEEEFAGIEWLSAPTCPTTSPAPSS